MGVWYRAGTVAVTSDSKTVTGTGTQWQNLIFGVAPGVTFYGPDGKPYEIDTVNSNTSLTLVTNYSGATASGQAYAIDPTRSGSVASLAAQTSEVLKFSQGQFTQIQNWFTGAASADVTLTSPAGQQITVPSYSKVTSEGEGQAARAKTEADKAAASAALAGDIVVASALPLPDVWAPLSDSLRMITGYGREVKVGEDVVSQMVNFSRNSTATYIGKDGLLKTAAVNAPRFEKEGLLIEGRSTNMVVQSEIVPLTLDAGYTITQSVVQGYNLHSCVYNSGDDALVVYTGATLQAADGTGSFVFNSATIVGNWGCYFNPTDNYVSFWPKNSSGFEYEDLGNGLIRASRKLKGTTPNVIHLRCGKVAGSRIDVGCYQIEALPFASSYIPTNGAAVTRAKDILYLAPSGNVPSDLNMAFAAQIKLMGYGFNSWPRVFEISGYENKGPFVDMQTGTWGGVNIVGIRNTLAARFSDTSHWVDGVKTGVALAPYPVRTYSEPVYIAGSNVVGSRDFYGHIRNLRVWFLSLTDDQMKVLR